MGFAFSAFGFAHSYQFWVRRVKLLAFYRTRVKVLGVREYHHSIGWRNEPFRLPGSLRSLPEIFALKTSFVIYLTRFEKRMQEDYNACDRRNP